MGGTHGSHWACIKDDVEGFLSNHFDTFVKEADVLAKYTEYGYNIESEQEQDNDISVLMYSEKGGSEEPIKYISIVVNKSLWTAYPAINFGMSAEVVIDAIKDWENLIEGQIVCHLANTNFQIIYFDPMYYANKHKYKVGETVEVLFGGFAYSGGLSQYDDTKIDIGNGETASLDGSTIFIPWEKGYIDDYKVLSPILDVKECDSMGIDLYEVKLRILNDIDTTMEVQVLISKENLRDGYVPKVGDNFNGTIWMTGLLL